MSIVLTYSVIIIKFLAILTYSVQMGGFFEGRVNFAYIGNRRGL